MRRRQGQRRDGDRGAGHVDRGAHGNSDGVEFLADAQAPREGKIHGNVRRRAARKEGGDPRLAQAAQHDQVGVGPRQKPHEERIHDQRHDQHGGHEQARDAGVLGEHGNAGVRHRRADKTEDAHGRQRNNVANHVGHAIGDGLQLCPERLGRALETVGQLGTADAVAG